MPHDPPHDPPTEDVLDAPLVGVKLNVQWWSHVIGLSSVAARASYWKSDQERGEESMEQLLDLLAKGNLPVFDPLSARVRRTTNQSIVHNVSAFVTFDTEDWDVGDLWRVADLRRLYLDEPGLWIIGANVAWQANAAGRRELRLITASGATIAWKTDVPTAFLHFQTFMTHWRITVPDGVLLNVYQDSGITLNIQPHLDSSIVFWANYLGPV